MKLLFTTHFNRAYKKAPKEIQHVFDKQSLLLLQSLRHPSLRAKKYNETEDKWQAASTRTGGSISGSWATHTLLPTSHLTLNKVQYHDHHRDSWPDLRCKTA